jgi:hypothetical protein
MTFKLTTSSQSSNFNELNEKNNNNCHQTYCLIKDENPEHEIQDQQNQHEKLLSSSHVKLKSYNTKNIDWFCSICDIYCNSKSQFDVHLISQKHKIVKKQIESNEETINNEREKIEPVNNVETSTNVKNEKPILSRVCFSISNLIKYK